MSTSLATGSSKGILVSFLRCDSRMVVTQKVHIINFKTF